MEIALTIAALAVLLAVADATVVRRDVGEPPCDCGPGDPCSWVDWGDDHCPGPRR